MSSILMRIYKMGYEAGYQAGHRACRDQNEALHAHVVQGGPESMQIDEALRDAGYVKAGKSRK